MKLHHTLMAGCLLFHSATGFAQKADTARIGSFMRENEEAGISLATKATILIGYDTHSNVSLLAGDSSYTYDLEQTGESWYRFAVVDKGRRIGWFGVENHGQDENVSYSIGFEKRRGPKGFGDNEYYFVRLGDKNLISWLRDADNPIPPLLHTAAGANDKGFFLQLLGYHGAALELFNEAIRREPARVVAYLNRADSYWAIGQKAAAQRDYRQYLVLMKQLGKNMARIPAYVSTRISSSAERN